MEELWFISYLWMKPGAEGSTVVDIRGKKENNRPEGGEGWGCIEEHPFLWVKKMKNEKQIFITLRFYTRVNREEFGMFQDIFN